MSCQGFDYLAGGVHPNLAESSVGQCGAAKPRISFYNSDHGLMTARVKEQGAH